MTTLLKPSGVRELAKTLGVNPSTVSRALSGKAGVSDDLRQQIVNAARGMDYAPNPHASSLRRNCGEGLALITGYQQPLIFSMRNDALMSLGRSDYGGIRVLVKNPDESLDTLVHLAISHYPRAIVVAGLSGDISSETRKTLASRRIPLVCMDGTVKGFDSVTIRRWVGTYQATRLLLLCGCRHPVFFSSASPQVPDERLKGIIEAYKSLGLDPALPPIIPLTPTGNLSFSHGYQITQDLLKTRPVDGIFCFNDEMAVGVLKALTDSGIKVPDEVKLVGFDNLPIAEYTTPQLTSVAQPVTEVAQAVLSMLASRLGDPRLPLQRERFEARLVIRNSASPATRSMLEEIFKLSETPKEKATK